MKKLNLNGNWKGVCYTEDGKTDFDFNGNVPSCVHTDLIAENIIDYDIFYRDNAEKCQWIENRAFDYTKTFTVPEFSGNAELVFEGLDTYTDIYLNGEHLASTDNMFIEHRFDLKNLLKKGENTLKVHFRSPIKEVEGLPALKGAFTTERLHSRRMQCTYGWDWVARFVTSGIYKDTYIEFEDNLTTDNVYIHTVSIAGGVPQICFEAEFKNYEKGDMVTLEIISPEGEKILSHNYFVKERELKGYIDLPGARLWYPAGYGEQPIYTLRLCGKEYKFGIRTARVAQIPDAVGSDYYKTALRVKETECGKMFDENTEFSGFQLWVNDIPVFCKGANWVPSEPFPSAEAEDKITEILSLAKEANLNMLRVWGGGYFEKDHFYDECDHLGIMVTQDFLMACGQYPEKEEWFLSHLQKEAEYACRLMRNQPCLVWYSGDNENAVNGSFEMEDYTGKTAYEKGLKPTVERLDRTRKLFPSSPYGGNRFASNTVGTTHHTQFLGRLFWYIENNEKLVDYKEELKKYRARFVAEEPIFGAVSLSSLKKFMTNEDVFSDDTDMWLYHSKGNPGLQKELMEYMLHFTERVLGTFKNPYDRYFKYKYFEYEWLRVIMEQARREKWFCSGIIFWMLNDCWTAASGWALIDYFNKPKLGYYSFKRCAKPILCSLDYENGKYSICVSNDALTDCSCAVELYKIKDCKTERLDGFSITCSANENAIQELSVALKKDEILIAELSSPLNDCRAFYKHGDLEIEKVENAVEYSVENDTIILTAKEYVHAVELESEAIFEDNAFSMLQGETKVVPFRYLKNTKDKTVTVETYALSALRKQGV